MIKFIAAAAMSCIAIGLTAPAFAADALQTPGKIESVTVYRGQALITRLVQLPGPPELREVVITDLPEHVVAGSLHAESADGVEVRSVLFRQRPVTQDVREEVRQLDQKIRDVQDKLDANAQAFALLVERKALIEKLEQFTAPTASVELTKGVLNPNSLKEMASYIVDHRKQISEEDLKLKLEKRDLEEQISLLQRQRQEVAGGSARTAREALVFVNATHADGELRLRYVVDQATWSPSYSVRAGEDRKNVTVEYYASITQLSGEDWSDVAMTLSTATPSLVAKAPTLEALTLALTPAQQQEMAQYGKEQFEEAKLNLKQQRQLLNSQRASKGQVAQSMEVQADQFDIDKSLNDNACNLQVLEWATSGTVNKSKGDTPGRERNNELSVTYQLAGRTSLPSRSDRQLIQIASLPLSGEFYKLATPVLTDSVYDEALITNSAGIVLLAGPVSTYLGGQFVGQGEIPTVAAGENFTLGFGIDSSLRASRELYEKTESLQGGNRVVELTYRLSIENFGAAAAAVRVMDRKPMSNGSDVKSTLLSAKPELSDNAAYRQDAFKKGLLRWDVEVPPQSVAAGALVIEYQLRLEYDKQMSISGMAMAAKPQP